MPGTSALAAASGPASLMPRDFTLQAHLAAAFDLRGARGAYEVRQAQRSRADVNATNGSHGHGSFQAGLRARNIGLSQVSGTLRSLRER